MKILSKFLIGAALVFFIVALVGWYFWNQLEDSGDLSYGYDYIWGREENTHIRKDGKVVIQPAIINMEKLGHITIGLRLKSSEVLCDDGKGQNILIENVRTYFILNMKTGEEFEFQDKQSFEEKLGLLKLKEKNSLDYTRFDEVWNRYSQYYKKDKKYYDSCVSK